MKEFKDSMNRWLTVGLFEETAGNNKSFILFSLEQAKELFIECNDITGYEFSKTHLGGWQHWKALLTSPVLSEYIEEWIEELEIKKRSEGLRHIEKQARGGHYQAQKYLADKGWVIREAGRPSKADVEKNINKEKRFRETVSHFLTPVK